MVEIFGKETPYIGDEGRMQEASAILVRHHFKRKESFHVPNEAKRSGKLGAKLKRQGLESGVSDWIITKPNENFNGLFIELKTAKRVKRETKTQGTKYDVRLGKIEDSQIAFLEQQLLNGHYACVCYSLGSLRKVIEDYKSNKIHTQ